MFKSVIDGLFRASRDPVEGFTSFLYELATRSAAMGRSNPSVAPKYLTDTREAHSQPTAGRLNAAALAASLGYSTGHLTRAFKSAFLMSPHAWRLTAKIEISKRRLRDGATVEQAARDAGFTNLSHFSRLYRARTGITARAYSAIYARTVRITGIACRLGNMACLEDPRLGSR